MEKNEEKSPKEQARQNFMNQLKMQMRQMGMATPPKDPTDEDLDQMVQGRIKGIKESLIEKDAELRVTETFLARVAANRNVLINVELKDAPTEWHMKAVQAEIDELQAIIDEKMLSFEKEKKAREKMLEEVRRMEELL